MIETGAVVKCIILMLWESLTADCYSDVEYVAYYYQSSGIAPSDLSFNVIAENNKIYVVYC